MNVDEERLVRMTGLASFRGTRITLGRLPAAVTQTGPERTVEIEPRIT